MGIRERLKVRWKIEDVSSRGYEQNSGQKYKEDEKMEKRSGRESRKTEGISRK